MGAGPLLAGDALPSVADLVEITSHISGLWHGMRQAEDVRIQHLFHTTTEAEDLLAVVATWTSMEGVVPAPQAVTVLQVLGALAGDASAPWMWQYVAAGTLTEREAETLLHLAARGALPHLITTERR